MRPLLDITQFLEEHSLNNKGGASSSSSQVIGKQIHDLSIMNAFADQISFDVWKDHLVIIIPRCFGWWLQNVRHWFWSVICSFPSCWLVAWTRGPSRWTELLSTMLVCLPFSRLPPHLSRAYTYCRELRGVALRIFLSCEVNFRSRNQNGMILQAACCKHMHAHMNMYTNIMRISGEAAVHIYMYIYIYIYTYMCIHIP